MARSVRVTRAASEDLHGISRRLAERGTPERALVWVRALQAHLAGFAEFPKRGMQRNAIRPGLRTGDDEDGARQAASAAAG